MLFVQPRLLFFQRFKPLPRLCDNDRTDQWVKMTTCPRLISSRTWSLAVELIEAIVTALTRSQEVQAYFADFDIQQRDRERPGHVTVTKGSKAILCEWAGLAQGKSDGQKSFQGELSYGGLLTAAGLGIILEFGATTTV